MPAGPGRTPQGVRGLKCLLDGLVDLHGGRTPQGVRGLKSLGIALMAAGAGRTPQGVRGLKLPGNQALCHRHLSHPARGAWIEIAIPKNPVPSLLSSHPARGAWIEICKASQNRKRPPGRTPQGVRGLKFVNVIDNRASVRSHPARGAWIEIRSWTNSLL